MVGGLQGGKVMSVLITYYNKNDLIKISIERFEKSLSDANVGYSKSLLEDPESEFVLFDADVFRQGVCQLFAYVLNEIFDYPIYRIEENNSFHVFCKSCDGSKYIDVRGVTDNFRRFIAGTECLYHLPKDTSKVYKLTKEDLSGDYNGIGLEFARAIIKDDIDRYTI